MTKLRERTTFAHRDAAPGLAVLPWMEMPRPGCARRFTDQAAGAALSGQYASAPMFTLDLTGTGDPDTPPLCVLGRLKGKKLH